MVVGKERLALLAEAVVHAFPAAVARGALRVHLERDERRRAELLDGIDVGVRGVRLKSCPRRQVRLSDNQRCAEVSETATV
jgi:hypothetical protein